MKMLGFWDIILRAGPSKHDAVLVQVSSVTEHADEYDMGYILDTGSYAWTARDSRRSILSYQLLGETLRKA
jgi:hypothetical protein